MSVYENPLREGRVNDPPLSHVNHSARAHYSQSMTVELSGRCASRLCTPTDHADGLFVPLLGDKVNHQLWCPRNSPQEPWHSPRLRSRAALSAALTGTTHRRLGTAARKPAGVHQLRARRSRSVLRVMPNSRAAWLLLPPVFCSTSSRYCRTASSRDRMASPAQNGL